MKYILCLLLVLFSCKSDNTIESIINNNSGTPTIVSELVSCNIAYTDKTLSEQGFKLKSNNRILFEKIQSKNLYEYQMDLINIEIESSDNIDEMI